MNYKTCWLTVNHACNLKCKWCYAKETGYKKSDDMQLNTAYDIIDICKELSINHITIIRGEPTIYPNLFDVLSYANKWGIRCGIVSNGLKYADESFVKKLISYGIKSVSISLKGEDQKSFYSVTSVNAFDKVCDAITVLKSLGIKISVSMVLTEENIDTYLDGILTMKRLGVDRFHLSFCYEFDTNQNYSEIKQNPYKLINGFVKNYDRLNMITEGKFELFQSFPLCLWEMSFIKQLEQRNQISSVCQLLHKNGLIFDPHGNLIPCNAMPSIKMGCLNVDFSTSEELMRYVRKKEIVSVYNQLCSVPDEKCIDCNMYPDCGGGCVCQWTKYSFAELMNMSGESQ